MSSLLITGSTGHLGAPTARMLAETEHVVNGLSRTAAPAGAAGAGAPARFGADLRTGAGVSEALRGVDTVVHLATTNSGKDVDLARGLAATAARAGVRHFVLISIVGVDAIPLGFYRQRVEVERVIERSGIPFTILRATQFHSFVDRFLVAQRRMPVLVAPSLRVQPVAVDDVAARLAELAVGEPQGRVADLGGPEIGSVRHWAQLWKSATSIRRPLVPLRLPGGLFRSFDAGVNVTEVGHRGDGTFERYLETKYGAEHRSRTS